MNGFVAVDKPLGRSSSDAVLFVRRRLPKGTAVGHGGTLDPEASGVLPVCVGCATRLFDFIVDKKKTYVAQLQLGAETDTQDATGQIVRTAEVKCGRKEIEEILPRFTGDILQIPPMYSAIKKDGRRLYQLARKGETVEVEPRNAHVDSIRLMESTGENRYRLEVCCGRGVYIRTLCHDIGNALGCGGHMAGLRRTAAGMFREENALTLEQIDALAAEGRLEESLIPMDAPLMWMPEVRVHGERAVHAVKNGNVLKPQWMEKAPAEGAGYVRIYLEDAFAGVGEPLPDGTVKFRAMLLRE